MPTKKKKKRYTLATARKQLDELRTVQRELTCQTMSNVDRIDALELEKNASEFDIRLRDLESNRPIAAAVVPLQERLNEVERRVGKVASDNTRQTTDLAECIKRQNAADRRVDDQNNRQFEFAAELVGLQNRLAILESFSVPAPAAPPPPAKAPSWTDAYPVGTKVEVPCYDVTHIRWELGKVTKMESGRVFFESPRYWNRWVADPTLIRLAPKPTETPNAH